MNSKQLGRRFPLRVVLYLLLMMFATIQPGFADDKKEHSESEQSTAEHHNSDDEKHHRDDEKHHGDDDDDDDNHHDDKPPPGGTPTENIIAFHDRNSPQYNDNCSSCHADIHTRQTLNPSIADAHVAMLPAAPGENNDDNKCKWCHRSVDLVQAIGSPQEHINNIRKHIDTRLCTLCHGPGGTGKQFYRVGISALNLGGADLYGLVCSGCHGRLTNSEVSGESASEIMGAINEDEGGMSPLQVLTPNQIQEIANALN